MLFWRLVSIVCLIIGVFLFVQSLLIQHIALLYWAIAFYSVASLVWLTLQKLYVEPFTPPKSDTATTVWWRWDWGNAVGIFLELPKVLYLFFIRLLYN